MSTPKNDTGWTLEYPELSKGPLPIEPYVSPEYFEREREKIFKRSWLSVGRVEEIPKAGDYFVKNLAVCNTSIIVVRGKDGVIRGFHNVCQHRGNKVVKACTGSAARFSCGFHGWTYDLEGQLIYVPEEDQFFDLKKSEHGLTPVPTDVWEGFIYVNVDPHPVETLQEFMGELAEQLRGYPFDVMERVGSYSAQVNANWKVIVDIGQESYHFAFVHGRPIPVSYTSKDNPYAHFLSIRLYKRHRSASVYANPEYKPTPAEALAFKYGSNVIHQGTAAKNALAKGVNPERSPHWSFDLIIIFPNSIISLGNGFYTIEKYWPMAVDRTLWESSLYMSKANNVGERIGQEFSKIFTRDLAREDLGAVERVQTGLASGVLSHMELSDQEIMLRHGYKLVEDLVGRCK